MPRAYIRVPLPIHSLDTIPTVLTDSIMRPSRSVVDHDSPSSANTDMTSLMLQCQELRQRNESLKKKNDELKQQLTHERISFEDVVDTMKRDMDTMKKTTTELEDQVNVLLGITGKRKGSNTLCEVASNDNDPINNVQTEGVKRILCNSDFRASIDQSFRRITRGPSSRLNTIKSTQLLSRTPSNDTYSTAECASDSASSSTSSSAEDNDLFTTFDSKDQSTARFVVKKLPWKCEESHLDGLYFGQLDSKTKLPDGLGEFHCEIGSNVKCIIKGEWNKGKLILSTVSFSYSEISSDDVSITEL